MENKFFYLAALCVLTHLIRLVYEILKHRKKIMAGRISFVIIFTNMMLLWISWFAMCAVDPEVIAVQRPLRYLGLAAAVLGLILFLWGLITIRTLETYDGNLITNGIYSRIRHPMYTGFICWLIGFPLYIGAMYSMLLAVPFIMNVLYWRRLEEIELLHRFYDYSEYRRRTWF